MNGVNKTFHATSIGYPAILRRNTELQLLITAVGGAMYFFRYHERYSCQTRSVSHQIVSAVLSLVPALLPLG
jgi:hypothetical protein